MDIHGDVAGDEGLATDSDAGGGGGSPQEGSTRDSVGKRETDGYSIEVLHEEWRDFGPVVELSISSGSVVFSHIFSTAQAAADIGGALIEAAVLADSLTDG